MKSEGGVGVSGNATSLSQLTLPDVLGAVEQPGLDLIPSKTNLGTAIFVRSHLVVRRRGAQDLGGVVDSGA